MEAADSDGEGSDSVTLVRLARPPNEATIAARRPTRLPFAVPPVSVIWPPAETMLSLAAPPFRLDGAARLTMVPGCAAGGQQQAAGGLRTLLLDGIAPTTSPPESVICPAPEVQDG